MIESIYISDLESPENDYRIRLTPVISSKEGGRSYLHLEICKEYSTFSKTQYTAHGADPNADSDNNFDYQPVMFTLDLDMFVNVIETLRKFGR
jgi:hypothetical protein